MNAYSTVISRKRRSLPMRLRSRAFREGFREGFGAPVLFLGTNDYKLLSTVDASVADAWKAVGDVLRASAAKQGTKVDKNAGEAESAA